MFGRHFLFGLGRKHLSPFTSSSHPYRHKKFNCLPKNKKIFIRVSLVNERNQTDQQSTSKVICAGLLVISETLSLIEEVDSNGILHFLFKQIMTNDN